MATVIDELQKTWHSTVIGCQKLGVGTRLGIAFFIFFSTFLFIQFRLKPDVRNMHSAHVVQNVDLDKSLLTVSQLRINFAIGSGSNILNVYLDETMDPNAVLKLVPLDLHKYLVALPKPNITNTPENAIEPVSSLDVSEIQRLMEECNYKQTVLNEDKFGPLHSDSLVIVLQVHKRIMYLQHAIVSLAQARGIEDALLIFSHDYYDERINELVRSIDFCKTMQMFYPNSIQTHPNKFPGQSPEDCSQNINKTEAIRINCTNALNQDRTGRYRLASLTQAKHHWWWKANRIFNELNAVKNYTGRILFLEEDHYVAPDVIHVLKLMEQMSGESCPQCSILTMGTYYLTTLNAYKTPKVAVSEWISGQHNMGMAYNRTVWKRIVGCARAFCEYDDYNWDWSLMYVSENCLGETFKAFVVDAPRVFHIGECGMHHAKNCFDLSLVVMVQELLDTVSGYLFPDKLNVIHAPRKTQILGKGFGNWGDVRDQRLCLDTANRSDTAKGVFDTS